MLMEVGQRNKLMEKIKTITELSHIIDSLKKKEKVIGLITGVFDVLHFEHIELLSFAKKKVDVLIVGVESDKNVKLFKGEKRPIFDFNKRSFVLSRIDYVDFIFKIPDIKKDKLTHPYYPEFYNGITKKIKADILITNISQDSLWKEKKQRAKELKIKFISYNKKSRTSSSKIISQIKRNG